MKKIILLSASLLLANTNITANEMNTQVWNFPSPDQVQVSQNRVQLFCDANPSKCPVGLSNNGGVGGTGSGGSLVDPNTSTSANNVSVVLAGDNSSVVLNTSQDAQDNALSADSETHATVENEEVLNYTNN